jgi:RNA polymerase sigma-70 factor (ECF subfamily)
MTDQEAVKSRLTIRDKAEFEILFKTYYSSLCAYANSFLKDVPASEDVVQEVMFKVWSGRNNLRITSSLQGYLFRAVRNGCLNVLKHADVLYQYKDRQKISSTDLSSIEEDTVVFSELQMKIRNTIDLLPMERKKIFILSRYEGLSYLQIAEKLEISIKTVENQIGKALKFLRQELAEYLPLLLLLFDFFHDN